jgi:hypothetical protein
MTNLILINLNKNQLDIGGIFMPSVVLNQRENKKSAIKQTADF